MAPKLLAAFLILALVPSAALGEAGDVCARLSREAQAVTKVQDQEMRNSFEYRERGKLVKSFRTRVVTRGLHKALQDARDATNDPEIITLRDQAGDIERAVELVYDDAQNGLTYTTARQAEEQAALSTNIAQAGHRLNRLAALFLPVSALGSVLGMNLVHGFEGRYAPWLFWCAVVATFSLGFIVRATLPSDERLRQSPR